MGLSESLDICRCGCAREDHPDGGPCGGLFSCQPGCGGFRLAHTGAEIAAMYAESVAHMQATREPESDMLP